MKNKLENTINQLKGVLSDKKAIIFDMDGTLIDSMGMWSHIDVEYMDKIGVIPNPDFHERVRSLTIPLAARYIHDTYNTTQTAKEIEKEFLVMVDGYYKDIIPLKPGVYELVKYLKASGYMLSVATANDINMCEVCLRRLGIFEDMEAIVNCDMAGAIKSEPDVFDLACRKMGATREECVVFEDSLHAIETARAAGYEVVGVYEETQADLWEDICKNTQCQVVFE